MTGDNFKIGDEVVLVKEHTYGGTHFHLEARVGSVGVVDKVNSSAVHVGWISHPDGFVRTMAGPDNSNVDIGCLRLNDGLATEEALDAEAARLFGLSPLKPANHCPTCICEEA